MICPATVDSTWASPPSPTVVYEAPACCGIARGDGGGQDAPILLSSLLGISYRRNAVQLHAFAALQAMGGERAIGGERWGASGALVSLVQPGMAWESF